MSEDAGTQNLSLSVTNPSGTAATTATVALTSGDAADIGNYTTQTVTFGAGQASAMLPITITDDVLTEPAETLTFTITGASGGTNAGVGTPATQTLTISASDPQTTVQFTLASASVTEGAGTATLTVSITNPSPTATTTADIALTGGTGTPDDIGAYTTQTITFPAGTTTRTVTVTITDDADAELSETFVFSLQSIAGGTNAIAGAQSIFTLTITDNDVPSAALTNARYVQDFTTPALANTGTSSTVPLGWSFFETGGNTTYAAGTGSDNGGNTYSFGASGSDDRAFGGLRSGSVVPTIGVRIRNGNAFSIVEPTITYTGEQWRTGGSGLVDRLDFQYSTDATSISSGVFTDFDALDFIAPVQGSAPVPLDGNAVANRTTITRRLTGVTLAPGATITLRWNDFALASGANDGLAVDDFSFNGAVLQTLSDVAGYRLLSAPVQGLTVDALADVNLVQGITGADGTAGPFEEQYPDAVPNLYTIYNDPATAPTGDVRGGYARPPSTSTVIDPGEGFFWQFYDIDTQPNSTTSGGGTSRSYALPARRLTATGTPITTDHTVSLPAATSRFYMIGNPFARPIAASAISVAGGIQGGLFQAWRPLSRTTGTYVQIFQTGTMGQTAADVWQGFFAETISTDAPTFQFDADAAVPVVPPFVGRPTVAAGVVLSLSGLTAAGDSTLDESAFVRFADGATAGWDALDASKLVPPTAVYALVAPTLDRDGARYRVAVDALPADATQALVPLSFSATHAGTYTLRADLAGLPEGWTAELRDTATGLLGDLAAGYPFTSDATDWTDRFVLALRPAGATAGEDSAPAATTLSAPRPNPATGRASLTLRLAAAERVTATVVDALGRTVATLYDAEAASGTDIALDVDASRLAPGVYVVRVQGATFAETRRLTVVR